MKDAGGEERRKLREPFCGISHLLGAVLAAAGLVALMWMARGRPWHAAGFAIYGVSLILLYTASGLYHSLHGPPARLRLLQKFDHAAIYLLIAGTYAPLCLTVLNGPWGFRLLGAEYALALVGLYVTFSRRRRPDWVRVVLYLAMGWLAVAAMEPLRAMLPPAAVAWLVAGGVIYSVGAIVYAIDRPHLWPGRFSAHDLWHLFVLGGSAAHFVLVAGYLA